MPMLLVAVAACSSPTETRVAPEPPGSPQPPSASVFVTRESGDGQWAVEGAFTPAPIVVRVARGTVPQVNVPVEFSIVEGGGSVSDTTVRTDASGIAALRSWRLGPAGSPQRLRARAQGQDLAFAAVSLSKGPASLESDVILMRGRSIIVLQRDGVERELVTLPQTFNLAALSDDESMVAGTDYVADAFCVIAVGSGERRCVPIDTLAALTDFNWSPDGRALVFSAQRKTRCAAGGTLYCIEGPYSSYLLDVSTMVMRRLPIASRNTPVATRWTPDGRSLVFVRDGKLRSVDPDGSNARVLQDLPRNAMVTGMQWSPNGRQLALSLWLLDRCEWLCDTSVDVFDVQSGLLRTIIEARTNNADYVNAPHWSPDGSRVAFTLTRDELCALDNPCGTFAYVAPVIDGAPVRLRVEGTFLRWRR
jgi:hypothetical protein